MLIKQSIILLLNRRKYPLYHGLHFISKRRMFFYEDECSIVFFFLQLNPESKPTSARSLRQNQHYRQSYLCLNDYYYYYIPSASQQCIISFRVNALLYTFNISTQWKIPLAIFLITMYTVHKLKDAHTHTRYKLLPISVWI